LNFLSHFQTLPLVSLATSHEVQPPAWPSWELIWVDLNLMVLLEFAYIALRTFGHLFEIQPSAWLFREPSDLSGLDQNSPLWPAVNSLWVSF
jgi:hypothetical protein